MHSQAHETNYRKWKRKQRLAFKNDTYDKSSSKKKNKEKVHRTERKQTNRVTEPHWNRDKSSGKQMH